MLGTGGSVVVDGRRGGLVVQGWVCAFFLCVERFVHFTSLTLGSMKAVLSGTLARAGLALDTRHKPSGAELSG